MDRLPGELLQLIAHHLDVSSLRAWMFTARRYYHSTLTDELYSQAVLSDEETHGHPVYLMIAAFLNQTSAFKNLLDKTRDINSPRIMLNTIPIDFDWDSRDGRACWHESPFWRESIKTSVLHVLCVFGREDLVRLALEKGADVSVYDSGGCTPLHTAVGPRGEDLAIVNILLDAGADVDAQMRHRYYEIQTSLHLAIEGKCTDIVETLVRAGANLKAPMGPRDGGTPERFPIPDDSGTQLLSLAARCGDASIVQRILNENNFDNGTLTDALHDAALDNEDASAIQALLDGGATLCKHAVINAVESDNLPVLRLFVDAGADLCQLDDAGDSLLCYVCCKETAQMLVEIAPGLQTVECRDPRRCFDGLFQRYARRSGWEDERIPPLAAWLLENICHMNPSSEDVHLAAEVAAQHLDILMLECILDDQPSLVSSRDCDQNTLLHLAASQKSHGPRDRLPMIKLLVERGCPINEVDTDGLSVLHTIFDYNEYDLLHRGWDDEDTSIARYLVEEAGIDISVTSRGHGGSAVLIAAMCLNAFENALLLIDAGILRFAPEREINEAVFIAVRNARQEILHRLFDQTGINVNTCRDPEDDSCATGDDTLLHAAVRCALNEHKRVEGFVRMLGCILLGHHDMSVAQVGGERRLEKLRTDSSGWLEIVRYLCRLGADALEARNSLGLTAFDLVKTGWTALPWDEIEMALKESRETGEQPLLNWAAGHEEQVDGLSDMFGGM